MAKNYRSFLLDLQSELREAIGDAENLEWHHSEALSLEWKHYGRLVGWEAEITERMVWYAAAKTRSAWKKLRSLPPGSSTGNVLGRYLDKRDDSE